MFQFATALLLRLELRYSQKSDKPRTSTGLIALHGTTGQETGGFSLQRLVKIANDATSQAKTSLFWEE